MRINDSRSDLWIDEDQGFDAQGREFGFIGAHWPGDYQGWFFVWPGKARRVTKDQIDGILATLDPDTSVDTSDPEVHAIDRDEAERVLRDRLEYLANC